MIWSFLERIRPSPQRQKRLALLAVVFFSIAALLAVVFWMILPDYGQWENLTSSRCNEFCESSHRCNHQMENRPILQQPVNAWSSLAYILVGLWPLIGLRVDISTLAYLLSNLYGGICSFLFHASVSTQWQRLDIAGSYTMILVCVFQGVYAVTGLAWKWLAAILLACAIAIPFIQKYMTEAGLGPTNVALWLVGLNGFWLLILVLARFRAIALRRDQQHSSRTARLHKCFEGLQIALLALFPGALFFLAAFVRKEDRNKEWCYPASVVQGHAIWHGLTAMASLWIWLFFDCNRLPDILRATGQPAAREEEDNQDDDRVPSKAEIMDPTDETFDLAESRDQEAQDEENNLDLTDDSVDLQQELYSEKSEP